MAEDPKTRLLGSRLESWGPLEGLATAALDAANYPRYGMSERDRSQIIGQLPGSPSYGPEAERYTSAALFARQNPFLAGLLTRGASGFSDWMYGTNYTPAAMKGVEMGARIRQSEMSGGDRLRDFIRREQMRRKAAVKR